jgi:GntR family transcriptional regulator/MocR family aminotransferase
MGHELRESAFGPGYYGDPAGDPVLRQAIVRHIGTSRGVVAEPDDVTVTNGTQQAIDLISRVLLTPGDRVVVEDPGYPPVRLLFTSLGCRVTGVPVDGEGLVVEALPDDARLVYVTPSHQFPLGSTMSLSRRTALLRWADRNGAAIVEDDYDSEFRFGGRAVEPLRTLDANGRVLYVGSFSKTMFASLRLGFVVAPAALSGALQRAKYVADWFAPLPTQRALATFIDEGWFARHIRRMRAVYQVRHRAIAEGIARQLADHLIVVPSTVGLHLSTTAAAASRERLETVFRDALSIGVGVHPLSMFSHGQSSPPGFAIGYGAIQIERIDEGLRLLRRAFDQALPAPRD